MQENRLMSVKFFYSVEFLVFRLLEGDLGFEMSLLRFLSIVLWCFQVKTSLEFRFWSQNT